VSNKTYNQPFSGIRGGGTLILGQDQDDINAGDLDKTQAYK